ncbi:hypothetical protein EDB89DRAFT_1940815 [Lactarius sanguifluus]|nr:hypothetical protein EDB89DRAFT_1940815 [Lactarius sanguifluus]
MSACRGKGRRMGCPKKQTLTPARLARVMLLRSRRRVGTSTNWYMNCMPMTEHITSVECSRKKVRVEIIQLVHVEESFADPNNAKRRTQHAENLSPLKHWQSSKPPHEEEANILIPGLYRQTSKSLDRHIRHDRVCGSSRETEGRPCRDLLRRKERV